VLDTADGTPASGIKVSLEVLSAGAGWTQVAWGTTDADGRVREQDTDCEHDHRHADEVARDVAAVAVVQGVLAEQVDGGAHVRLPGTGAPTVAQPDRVVLRSVPRMPASAEGNLT